MENAEYYVVRRDGDFSVVGVPAGDPLYGRGTWSEYAGPFASVEEAETAATIGELAYTGERW